MRAYGHTYWITQPSCATSPPEMLGNPVGMRCKTCASVEPPTSVTASA